MHPAPGRPESGDLAEMLNAAWSGDIDALGELLEDYRLVLTQLARRTMPKTLRGKGGGSDLVQETFLDAFRDFHRFHGNSPDELLTWLLCLLDHNFSNHVRRYRGCAKRNVHDEVTLDAVIDADDPDPALIAPTSDPSWELMRQESANAVRQALRDLSKAHREVLRLRYDELLEYPEIGLRLGVSDEAARKRCRRAVAELGRRLKDEESVPEAPLPRGERGT